MLSAVPGTTDTYDSSMQMSAYDTQQPFNNHLTNDFSSAVAGVVSQASDA